MVRFEKVGKWRVAFAVQCKYSVETGIKLISDFRKKSRNRSIFVFPYPYFGIHIWFCISAPGSSQPPLTFFFKRKGMASDTSFESPLPKEFPEYFQSIRAKKYKPTL
jgi:hypothetical protein